MNWSVVREPSILVTSVIYGLLLWILLNAGIWGLFGLFLGIVLFISLWRYCYTVLLSVAQGHARIPPPDVDSMNPVGKWAWFWHWFFFPGLVIATARYQPLGAAVALAAVVIFPASAGVMGVTSSLSGAFNPAALHHFVRTLGVDYWKLVLGFVAIVAGAFLFNVVAPVLGYLAGLPGTMLIVWALLASFALIGAALRAHRLEFEIPGEVVPLEDRALEQRHRDWRRMLDIAYASFRSGIQVSGYNTLHNLVAANNDSIEVNYWLVENMLEWEDKKYALDVATKLFPRLVARGDLAGALQLYQRCRRRSPEYRPPARDAAKIGEFATTIGQTGVAAELGFKPKPPGG